jgi:peptidoglycan/xylan/chitin deacetylase (PgdA/CDA1 family)
LSLTVHGNTFSWIVGNSANSTAEGIIAKQRKNVVLSVYRLLLSLCDEKRQEAIKQLRAWSGVEKGPPLQRVLSADEIVRLAQGGLVEVGAHTVTHPFLAKLPGSTQRREVQESKGYLEEVLGQPVRSFSYPNGSFSRETLGIVRDSGYACACDSIVNIVWRRSNCFQLPRFWVNDWDGDTFSRHLKRWLGG